MCRSSGQFTRASSRCKKRCRTQMSTCTFFIFSPIAYCNCLQYVACQILAAGGFFQLAVDIVGVDFDDLATAGGCIK